MIWAFLHVLSMLITPTPLARTSPLKNVHKPNALLGSKTKRITLNVQDGKQYRKLNGTIARKCVVILMLSILKQQALSSSARTTSTTNSQKL